MVTLIGAALGCTTIAPHATREAVAQAVQGPGSLFGSIDDAAADALAWSYVEARRDRGTRRVRAGVISAVSGGYTYDEVLSAPVLAPTRVQLRLEPGDVAHFRYIPEAAERGATLGARRHTSADRELVDRIDPLHRASYLMSPDRVVRVYAGGGEEFVLGSLDDWLHRTPRWGQRPVVRVSEITRDG